MRRANPATTVHSAEPAPEAAVTRVSKVAAGSSRDSARRRCASARRTRAPSLTSARVALMPAAPVTAHRQKRALTMAPFPMPRASPTRAASATPAWAAALGSSAPTPAARAPAVARVPGAPQVQTAPLLRTSSRFPMVLPVRVAPRVLAACRIRAVSLVLPAFRALVAFRVLAASPIRAASGAIQHRVVRRGAPAPTTADALAVLSAARGTLPPRCSGAALRLADFSSLGVAARRFEITNAASHVHLNRARTRNTRR
jgi:hypothetical protein